LLLFEAVDLEVPPLAPELLFSAVPFPFAALDPCPPWLFDDFSGMLLNF
jgi:hypothetical protein